MNTTPRISILYRFIRLPIVVDISVTDNVFVAGSDAILENSWVTRFNRPLEYVSGFGAGEPDGGEAENCLVIPGFADDGLYATSCAHRSKALCESGEQTLIMSFPLYFNFY